MTPKRLDPGAKRRIANVLPRLRASLRRRLAGFGVNDRGAAALEFAIVAIPFLMLLFGIIEMSMVFIIGVVLGNATAYYARQIRVGALEATSATSTTTSGIQWDLNTLKTNLCNQIVFVSNATCMSDIQVDVRVLSAFNGSTPSSPVSGKTFNTSGLCYYSGGPGDIVEMRVYYLWPLINPALMLTLANITTYSAATPSTSGAWSMIYDTEVVKNEAVPNLSNPGTGC